MVKDNKKLGFSLAEALMSMLIISVFFVAATKIVTQKPPKETEMSPHGFFECYYRGRLYTHALRGDSEVPEAPAANCNFQPPAGLSFINVHYVTGNTYLNSQEPLFEQRIEIGSPGEMQSKFYPHCFSGSNSSCSSMVKSKTDFYYYLHAAHPKSNIYRMWVQGTVPTNVLFISW